MILKSTTVFTFVNIVHVLDRPIKAVLGKATPSHQTLKEHDWAELGIRPRVWLAALRTVGGGSRSAASNTPIKGGHFIKSHDGLCFPPWLLTTLKKRNKTGADAIRCSPWDREETPPPGDQQEGTPRWARCHTKDKSPRREENINWIIPSKWTTS